MPKRLLLLLLAFMLLALPSYAQSFEPGLLVRSTGDTLRGEIENGFWEEPPSFIRFRPTPGSPDVLFAPRQLRLVSLTGGRRFRYEALPIDHAAETRYDHLPFGFHTDVQTDSVLAEVLLEGPVLVLRVPRTGATHYLLRRPGMPVLDLSERKYLREDAGTGRQLVTDGNNYRGQLVRFFGDCSTVESTVRQISFTPEDLVRVAQAYTAACASQAVESNWLAQARPRQPSARAGGLVGGLRYTSPAESAGPAQLQPFAGVYGESFLPGRLLAFYGELGFSPFKGQGTVSSYTQRLVLDADGRLNTVTFRTNTPYTYRSLLTTVRVGLRYHYPLPEQRQWFIGAGLESGGLLFSTVTLGAGSSAMPDKSVLYYPGQLPRINLGTGWRTPRLTVGADVQLLFVSGYAKGYALRLSTAYRLTRHPDAAGRRP